MGFRMMRVVRSTGGHIALRPCLVAVVAALALGLGFGRGAAQAEFGDVVINNYSDKAGMRPVVYPHWFHRIRFTCKVCHGDLDFKFQAGGNDVNMLKIFNGEFCGACHDGQIAWGVENCILCHSGKPNTRTRVHGSTLERLVVPLTPTSSQDQ